MKFIKLIPLTFLIGYSTIGKTQVITPNPDKNPVKAMFFQRYLHIRSLLPTLNFKFKTQLFHYSMKYVSPLNKKGWQLTFEDNFDSINKEKWRLGQPWGDFHDASLHQYHDANNVITKDGLLYLLGKYNPKEFKLKDSIITIPYSIGLINSDISFMQKYGYFEIRCKNPKGPATWPAFWLTGAHRWPPEIDIFEMYGKSSGNRIHKQISSIHYGISGHKSRGTLIRKIWLPKDTDTAFHVYACKWTPKAIKFYTDGVLVRKQRINKRLRLWMDDEMVIIINNGFEAKYLKYLPENFKGNAFVVDWVRVYKKSSY
jgi:beta-glucanase (GH16 family)